MYTTTDVRHRDGNRKITGWVPNSKRTRWGAFQSDEQFVRHKSEKIFVLR